MKRKSFAAFVLMATMFPAVLCAGAGPPGYVTLARNAETDRHRDDRSGHWMAPRAAAERRNPIPADRASLVRGKKLFEAHCTPCHGVSGRGDGPAAATLTPKPSDLREMAGEHPAGDLAWKIANGRGPMPAWKETLSESQIWDLVNYLKSLNRADKKSGDRNGRRH